MAGAPGSSKTALGRNSSAPIPSEQREINYDLKFRGQEKKSDVDINMDF